MNVNVDESWRDEIVGDRRIAWSLRHLSDLADLTLVLNRLIEYPHVPEVEYLDFQVFCDGFSQGFAFPPVPRNIMFGP